MMNPSPGFDKLQHQTLFFKCLKKYNMPDAVNLPHVTLPDPIPFFLTPAGSHMMTLVCHAVHILHASYTSVSQTAYATVVKCECLMPKMWHKCSHRIHPSALAFPLQLCHWDFPRMTIPQAIYPFSCR